MTARWKPPGAKPRWTPPVGAGQDGRRTQRGDVGVGAGPMDWLAGFGGVIGDLSEFAGNIAPTFKRQYEATPSFAEHPIGSIGWTALSATMIPSDLVRYGAGVAVGGMQALGEAVGANPRGQPIDVEQRIKGVDFTGVQNIVQAAPMTWPERLVREGVRAVRGDEAAANVPQPMTAAIDNLVPNSLQSMFDFMKAADEPTVLQSTQGGNILDPVQAHTRFRAVAPQQAEFAVDIAGSTAGFGAVARGAKAGIGLAGKGLGVDYGAARAVTNPFLGPQKAQALQTAIEKPGVAGAIKTAKTGIPLVAGGVAGATTPSVEGAERGSTEWFTRAGERALGVGILAYAGTSLGAASLRAATMGATKGITAVDASWDPVTRAIVGGRNRFLEQQQRGASRAVVHPGATWGWFWDSFFTEATDSLSKLRNISRFTSTRRTSGAAATDAGAALPEARLGAERQASTSRALREHSGTLEQDYLIKKAAVGDATAARSAAEKALIEAEKLAAQPSPSLPTVRSAYDRFMAQPDDPATVQSILASIVDDVGPTGKPIKKLVLAPGMEAVMSATGNPLKSVWRQRWGSTGTRNTYTLPDLIRSARGQMQRDIDSGAHWLDNPIDAAAAQAQATAAAEVAAKAAAARQAVEAAKTAENAAKVARDAARGPLSEAEKLALAAEVERETLAGQVAMLENASDMGAHAPGYMDEFGKLAQMLKNIDSEANDVMKRLENIVGRPHVDPTDPTQQWGLRSAQEQKTFDTWLRGFGAWNRAERGMETMLAEADSAAGQPAIIIRTAEEGRAAFLKMLEDLRIDPEDNARYMRTLQEMNKVDNEAIIRMRNNGDIASLDAFNILENPFYLRGSDISDILTTWNPQAMIKAQKMFAGARPVQHETLTTGPVWDMNTKLHIERHRALILFEKQSAVMRALDRSAKADPTGLGYKGIGVRRHLPTEEVTVRALASRGDAMIAARINTVRELRQVRRGISGPGVGRTIMGRISQAEYKLKLAQEAKLKPGLTPRQEASIDLRIDRWTKQLQEATADHTAATARAAQLKDQLSVVTRQVERAQKQLKAAERKAPRAKIEHAIAKKTERAGRLTAEAEALEAEAARIADPAKAKKYLDQAETLRRNAASNATAADELASTALPDPPLLVTVPYGFKALPVIENGSYQVLEVPDHIADLAMGVGTPQIDAFTRILGGTLGHIWRTSVTTLSVAFSARNIPRDFQTAYVNYGNMRSPTSFVGDYIRAWGDVLGTQKARLVEDVLVGLSKPTSNAPGAVVARGVGKALGKDVQGWAGREADRIDEAMRAWSQTERMQRAGVFSGSRYETGLGMDVPPVEGPLGLLKAIARISEMPGRGAVFRQEIRRGASDLEAGYEARTIVTDFSKSGHAMRVANLFMPLLNARMQGEMQSFDALRDNPQAFVSRMTATAVLPYMISYVWNRSQFGDLQDMINPDVLARNAPLIYGSWFNEEMQREEPLYLKIPLTDVSAAVTIPMRYLLDEKYHRETTEGVPLPSGQRGPWSPTGVLKSVIAGFIPTAPQEDELDPFGVLKSAIMMNPAATVAVGMMTNEDRFRRRAIMDPEAPTLWDRYRWTEPDRSTMSQVATELFGAGGKWEVAHFIPAQADFAIRSLLGGFATPPMSVAGEATAKALHDMVIGGPLPSERRLTPQELEDAPAGLAEYVNQAKREDARPALQRGAGFLFGSGGNAQSIIQRLRQDDPKKWKRWRATIDYQTADREETLYSYNPEKKDIYEGHTAEWTHAKINDEMIRLASDRRARRKYMQEKQFPDGVYDPTERRKFLETVPGVPIDINEAAGMMGLPQGIDVAALAYRYENPPGYDRAMLEAMNPTQKLEIQGRQLETMARELSEQHGQPISSDALGRAIKASERGLTIPALMLPEVYVDEWVDRWRAPAGFKEGDPPQLMRAARERELVDIVNEYGVVDEMIRAGTLDPAQDPMEQATQAVAEILNTQFMVPGEVLPSDVSRDDAYAVAARVRDDKYAFMDQDGNQQGDATQHRAWNDILKNYEMSGISKDRWPVQAQVYDRMRAYGEVHKVIALYNDPNYLDYSRWFGNGRTMTPVEWAKYQSGEVAKYKLPARNGQPERIVPAGKALELDFLVALYRALPSGPQKDKLLPIVKRIRSIAVPNWQNALDIYELQDEQTRKLSDDILAQDRLREQGEELARQNYADATAALV